MCSRFLGCSSRGSRRCFGVAGENIEEVIVIYIQNSNLCTFQSWWSIENQHLCGYMFEVLTEYWMQVEIVSFCFTNTMNFFELKFAAAQLWKGRNWCMLRSFKNQWGYQNGFWFECAGSYWSPSMMNIVLHKCDQVAALHKCHCSFCWLLCMRCNKLYLLCSHRGVLVLTTWRN